MKHVWEHMAAGLSRKRSDHRFFFTHAQVEIAKENLHTLRVANIALFLLVLFFFLLSKVLLTEWNISSFHMALLPGAVVFGGFALWYEGRTKRTGHLSPPLMTGVCVVFLLWVLGSVTVIDVYPYPGYPSSFFPVLIVALPLLFVIRYRLLYPVLLLSEGVYSFLVLRVKAPSIRSHDLFTSMMALVISLVLLAVVMQLRIQDGDARIRYRMLSETDLLTGILNKAACENSVRQYIARHGGSTCALLMLDIDDFKQINDMFGHQVGDWLLEKMGQVLRHVFRATDIIGRTGGDEFMLCIKDFQREDVLRQKCSQIQEQLRQEAIKAAPDIFAGTENAITCSIGAALSEGGHLQFEELVLIADDALYEAKFQGKGRCVIYTVGSPEEAVLNKGKKPLVFVAAEQEDERNEWKQLLMPEFSVLTAGWDSQMMGLLSRYQGEISLLILSGSRSEKLLRYRKVRQRLHAVPTVVIVHHADETERAKRAGANDVWMWPLTKERAIEKARRWVQPPTAG